ncbi:MAG: hypothetical protein ACP5EP_08830 [Acidobacteriaceae bacterium]
MQRRTRFALFGLALFLLAAIVAVSVQRTVEQQRLWRTELLERNPLYLRSERLQVAAAQASMDALAMAITQSGAQSGALYQQDYRLQRMQMQANWLGMERLAANDPHRQGLLMEIRASLADLSLALDQTAAATTAPSPSDQARLMAALQRTQHALANYSGSLAQGAARDTTQQDEATWYRSVWASLVLLLLACATLMPVLEFSLRRNEKGAPSVPR